jgi:hypothetical protein
MEEVTVKKAISELIGCTRRKRRPKSIVEIADIIEFLRAKLGTYRAVADRVDLSTEMLREFRAVKLLAPEMHRLVAERTIDSVDLVYRISKSKPATQKAIVRKVLQDALTGNDVRVVKSSSTGQMSEQKALLRTIESRDIKTYLIRFQMPKRKSASEVQRDFSRIVGANQIVSLKIEKGVATLGLSYRGQKRLREAAKQEKEPLREFVMNILEQKRRRENKV